MHDPEHRRKSGTVPPAGVTVNDTSFFLLVFEILSPYTTESDMWRSRGGPVIVLLSMRAWLVLKVHVSHERDLTQAAFAGVLVAGHVLMIFAVVVEAGSACYASWVVEGGGGGI